MISSIYGNALFDLAQEEDRLDAFAGEVTAVRQLFLDNEEMSRLLAHPQMVKEEKLAFLKRVFEGKISEEMMGFLSIIVEKDRYDAIIPIFDHFLSRVREHKGIGSALVASAMPLTDVQKQAVEKKLLDTTEYQSFDMDYQVEPELLGGLVIRIGDRIVDGSLKAQVDQLSRKLSGRQA